jgi:DNA mismatch endonuclease (patch repair protein)
MTRTPHTPIHRHGPSGDSVEELRNHSRSVVGLANSPPGSWAISLASRHSMQANTGVDTKPEQRLRSALHRQGLRFRKHYRLELGDLHVRPDVVFTRHRVAIFLDGCFWHRCPAHGSSPRANSDYWEPKLTRNVERDARVDRALRSHGWAVIRIWEHEDPAEAAAGIARQLR